MPFREDTASVHVNGTQVYIVESRMKVMLEDDYLALESNRGRTDHGLGGITQDELTPLSGVSSDIVREVLLPEIEREVNEGKHFAKLRQIYHSMILASWFKKNLKDSLIGRIYSDQNITSGIEIEDTVIKEKIYNQYLEAYKKGVYDYIREDYDAASQQIIPRKYSPEGQNLQT